MTIFILVNGKMTSVGNPGKPERANFVICCEHGDWSGFRTLADCVKQFPELESKGKHNGYYWVEERV